MRYSLILFMVSLFLASCARPTADGPFASFKNKAGIDHTGFDPATRPQDDLYHYVNGSWIDKTDIPDDLSNIGVVTTLRRVRNLRVIRFLAEFTQEKDKTPGTDAQVLGDLFYSLLQEKFIDKQGTRPIKSLLEEIEKINNKDQLESTIAKLVASNVRVPFGFDVRPDSTDPSQPVLTFFQGNLSMPNREYYLNADPEFEKVRRGYKTYLEKILGLAKFTAVSERAQNAYEIELLLAKGQLSLSERRDPRKIRNYFKPAALNNLTDKLNWDVYLGALGVLGEPKVNVNEVDFFIAFGEALESQPLESWKDYLRVAVLDAFAPFLENNFRTTYYDFYEGVIGGIEVNSTRLQGAIFLMNDIMGEAVGRAYAERYFAPSSRSKIEKLIENMKGAFRDRIDNNSWMSNPTKAKAIFKLDNILTEIGHPDQGISFTNLVITKETPILNLQNIYSFYFDQKLKKLGTPIKRNAWLLNPQSVNAQFLLYQNAMFYPAAFLEPPYFNLAADDAVNYAGIGVVIGHELGHAFDDQGRQFGPTGALEDWWAEADAKNFKKRSEALVDLFNQYSPIDGMAINGQLTLGENIGDLVGVQIAYDAYIKSLGGKEAPIIDGLTGSQRFFIGYAQSVRSKTRPETLRQLLVSDPHSPNEFRVKGILPHIPAFYEAFDIKEGDGMYLPPEDRISIW